MTSTQIQRAALILMSPSRKLAAIFECLEEALTRSWSCTEMYVPGEGEPMCDRHVNGAIHPSIAWCSVSFLGPRALPVSTLMGELKCRANFCTGNWEPVCSFRPPWKNTEWCQVLRCCEYIGLPTGPSTCLCNPSHTALVGRSLCFGHITDIPSLRDIKSVWIRW